MTAPVERRPRPFAAEELPQRNHVKSERERHEECRHQCQREARDELCRRCREEDLCRAWIRHDPKPDGDDEIGHTEYIPDDRALSSLRRVEMSRNPWSCCSNEDVPNTRRKRPQRR